MSTFVRTQPTTPPWGRLILAAVVAGAVGSVLAWPLSALGAAVGLSTLMSSDTSAVEGQIASWMLAAGPFFVWIGFVPGLPLAAWMVRRGRAGWGVAILGGIGIGLALALLGGALAGPLSFGTFTVLGGGAGLLFWVALRGIAPGLFRPAAT